MSEQNEIKIESIPDDGIISLVRSNRSVDWYVPPDTEFIAYSPVGCGACVTVLKPEAVESELLRLREKVAEMQKSIEMIEKLVRVI